MSFKALLCFGAMALTMTSAAETPSDDHTAAEPSLYSAAYLSAAKPVAAGPPYDPYEGAVASASTNVVRSPGNFGQVTAFHKTAETPFTSAHKSDVQQPYHPAGPYAALAPYPAPVQYPAAGQYPYAYPAAGQYQYAYPAAGQYPYAYPTGAQYPYALPAAQYPYAPAGQYPYAPAGQYPYAPTAVGSYPYAPAAVGSYPYAAAAAAAPQGPIKPYGYGPVVTPQSVSHASFSGPYGAHYSYKR